MATYLFVYHGGNKPQTPDDVQKVINAWANWYKTLDNAVIDDGNPVGLSTTIHSDGSISNDGGSNPASGYSLIDAKDLQDAIEKAKGCPILASGGSVELAETM